MTTARSRLFPFVALLAFVALLGMLLATIQVNPAVAAAGTGCRVALLRWPPLTGDEETASEPFTLASEVDGDGVADVVRLQESSGSGASSTWGTLTLSASGEEIRISSNVSYSQMINITVVPPALVGDDRAAARRLVEDALFGMTCYVPEPSLSRLLDMGDAVVWREGRPALPPGNYAVYFPEAPTGLIPFIGAWSELGFGSGRPAAVWVEYLGGTQVLTDEDKKGNIKLLDNGFEVLAMTPRYRVLGARHGVVALDIATDRYAWLYVFSGGHKLRWKSIKGATIDGSEVTITALDRNPGEEQVGTITLNLHEHGYAESWVPRVPDANALQPQPE